MTLHVVLGNGYMPTKELHAHLQDMKEKALADDDGFWFLVEAKAEPTDTDQALVKWLNADPPNDIYFDAIGDKDSADKIYSSAQTVHKATKLAPKIVQLMKKAVAGDEENEPEGADLLALFFSDEEDAEEDRWLNDVIADVAAAGFPVYAFNDGMTLLEPPSGDDEEPLEIAVEAEFEVEEVGADVITLRPILTREELEALELDDLKKMALDKGIEVPPRSRRPTYIDAILGVEEEAPEVEVEEPPAYVNTTATYTTGNTTGNLHIMGTEISGPAMVIVVYNGQVTSRIVTVEQARELAAFGWTSS